jgi:uncharacterized protein (DUF58 family)
MSDDALRMRSDIADALRFMSSVTFIACGAGIPIALWVGSRAVALLILLVTATWHLVCVPVIRFLARKALPSSSRLRYRLTRSGFVMGVAAGFSYVLSLRWSGNVGFLATALLGAAIVCSILHPRMMLGGTVVDVVLPDGIFAGVPFSAEITLRNTRRLLSAHGLTIAARGAGLAGARHIIRLPPGAQRRVMVGNRLERRGLQKLPPFTIRSLFPFGLIETSFQAGPPEQVLVLPRLGHLDYQALERDGGPEIRLLLQRRRRDQQGDFRSLRQYRNGDNPRHIHWATSARMGELHVREFERREMAKVSILLDAHSPVEDAQAAQARRERFETAVSFAATLADLLTDRGVPFAFASLYPEPAVVRHGTGPGHRRVVLECLALAELTPQHGPADLIGMARERLGRSERTFLVSAGPVPDALHRPGVVPRPIVIDISKPELNGAFQYQA